MSGRDEEPVKDFPGCKACEENLRLFVYWRYESPERLEKNIYFNPGIGKVLRHFKYEILPVPIYDVPKGGRMCTLEELDAIHDEPIVCNRCRLQPSSNVRATIIRVARRKIIEYEGIK